MSSGKGHRLVGHPRVKGILSGLLSGIPSGGSLRGAGTGSSMNKTHRRLRITWSY